MHVSKITRKKGISKRNQATRELVWNEASIEVTLGEADNPEEANEMADMLLYSWLKKGEREQ